MLHFTVQTLEIKLNKIKNLMLKIFVVSLKISSKTATKKPLAVGFNQLKS